MICGDRHRPQDGKRLTLKPGSSAAGVETAGTAAGASDIIWCSSLTCFLVGEMWKVKSQQTLIPVFYDGPSRASDAVTDTPHRPVVLETPPSIPSSLVAFETTIQHTLEVASRIVNHLMLEFSTRDPYVN